VELPVLLYFFQHARVPIIFKTLLFHSIVMCKTVFIFWQSDGAVLCHLYSMCMNLPVVFLSLQCNYTVTLVFLASMNCSFRFVQKYLLENLWERD
jgi:hypothetical protein